MATDATQAHAPFYIAWKHIATRPQHAGRPTFWRRTSLENPPVLKEAFETLASTPVFLWTPGRLQTLSQSSQQYMIPYKTSSVYWCPHHGTYLTVPYDCTAHSVRERTRLDELDDWERLKFGHESINGRCVSVLGHRYPNDDLAAAGPQNWVPELIPPIHQRHKPPTIPDNQGPSWLAGDISILMGLAALSTTPDKVERTIRTSFRPANSTTWVQHMGIDVALQRERGIVVHIFTDNRYPKMIENLAAWESGTTRAILS